MNNNIYQKQDCIFPSWSAPSFIKALTTTRIGGTSCNQYASFNISDKVGDSEKNVLKNREILTNKYKLPSAPLWLNQTHSNKVIFYCVNILYDGSNLL